RYGFNVGDVEIVVGWDNPTQTFFGQVEVRGNLVIDTMSGSGQFDVKCLHSLESMISFSIPDDIRSKLIQERDHAPSPTPLQKRMTKIFASLEGDD
ncbi:hypothetical protein LCGC14_2264420, partial [marine sediment metagenome]